MGLQNRPFILMLIGALVLFDNTEQQGQSPVIRIAPSENVVVLQGQTTLVNFNCITNGNNVLWIINGTLVHHKDHIHYKENGITFYPDSFTLSEINISIGINVTTARNNNTELSCFASSYDRRESRNSTSPAVTLSIAGPPLAPHPKFHVVNATYIQVQWDKPFSLPEFDVRQYTLLIVNTSSGSDSTRYETFHVSANTTYPIRYYMSNGGDIPKECMYVKFLLTAINDAGTSDIGSVTGGFPIAPSPILDDTDSLQHKVTFILDVDLIPTLHINFSFPEVCHFQDAKFSIQILGEDGSLVYQSMEETYDKDSPDNIEVTISKNLQRDSSYIAEINISTAVNWTITQFKFATTVSPSSFPPPIGVQGLCSIVVWYSPAVFCEDIRGYEVRLYHPQSPHLNMTSFVGANSTFYMVDEEKLVSSDETFIQVRAIHQTGVGEWSEGSSLGCEKPTAPEKPPRVHFELNGKVYLNNSAIAISEIGEGTSALYCRTDKEECCGVVPNRFGQFYYPSGVQIPIANKQQGFYRNRGNQIIRLNRREGITSPTGTYRCEIPNADDETVNIYITLTVK